MATMPDITGYDTIRALKRELRAQGDRRNYPDLVALSTNTETVRAWISDGAKASSTAAKPRGRRRK